MSSVLLILGTDKWPRKYWDRRRFNIGPILVATAVAAEPWRLRDDLGFRERSRPRAKTSGSLIPLHASATRPTAPGIEMTCPGRTRERLTNGAFSPRTAQSILQRLDRPVTQRQRKSNRNASGNSSAECGRRAQNSPRQGDGHRDQAELLNRDPCSSRSPSSHRKAGTKTNRATIAGFQLENIMPTSIPRENTDSWNHQVPVRQRNPLTTGQQWTAAVVQYTMTRRTRERPTTMNESRRGRCERRRRYSVH